MELSTRFGCGSDSKPRVMEHFSHEHPLILREVLKEDGEDRVCYACLEPIAGHAYSCTECDFFLHKTCGDQPRTIERGIHPQHPLTLFQHPPYGSSICGCDVCGRIWKRFTYSCKPCGFDACISCVSGKIRNISHDHSLISTDALKLDGLEVICHACQKQIKDHAFSCSEHCDFLLHQECLVLLKPHITHFSHPQHQLFFHKRPPYNSSRSPCDYCGNSWEHFTYYCDFCRLKLCVPCASLSAADVPPEIEHVLHPKHPLSLFVRERYSCSTEPCKCCGQFLALLAYGCDLCKFNICMSCASCALSPQLTEPSFHEHPLIIMREALFKCDACGADDKDMSYLCTTCKFWVHKSCALLESRIECGSHRHPLTLSYSLPEEYVKFKQSCGICGQRLKPVYWVYACSPCRYFAHVKCATRGETENFRNGESQIREDQEDLDSNLTSLPIMSYDSRNLMISFLRDVSLKEIQRGTELHHISHGHPLILCDVSDNIGSMETDVLVCHGCTQAITGSFYACSQCSFLLHRICAELPHEVQCASHPEHPLVLHPKAPNSFTLFYCQACENTSNGISYRCDTCNFKVDLMCAYLPHTVSHEAHNHPLQIRVPDWLPCNGCSFIRKAVFECNVCNFFLDANCALLPRTASHRYDPHPLILSYPPFDQHPGEFYCEECQQEINPNFWLYHCSKCDQSFHTWCLFPRGSGRGIRYGAIFKLDGHQHLLRLVQMEKGKCTSMYCDGYITSAAAMTCTECNFNLCLYCALVFRGGVVDEKNLRLVRE